VNKVENIILLLITFICFSCGSGLAIQSEKLKKIEIGFNNTFNDNDYVNSNKISHLFHLNRNGYKPNLDLDGKLSKRGYFQIYLTRYVTRIPPLFPIIYSDVLIDRRRIGITKNNELVIDEYYQSGKNIFILGNSTSDRYQFFFKKTE